MMRKHMSVVLAGLLIVVCLAGVIGNTIMTNVPKQDLVPIVEAVEVTEVRRFPSGQFSYDGEKDIYSVGYRLTLSDGSETTVIENVDVTEYNHAMEEYTFAKSEADWLAAHDSTW